LKTLRGRLNRGLVIILVAVFAAHWVIGSMALHQVTENEILTRLEHDGDALLASLDFDRNGLPAPSPAALEPIYRERLSGHYYLVYAGAARYASPSAGTETVPGSPLAAGTRHRFHAEGPGHQPLLVLVRGVVIGGQPVTIALGEDLTAIHRDIEQTSLAFLALNALVLMMAILLQAYDVRRAFRPFVTLRQELAMIAGGRQARITAQSPWEIQPFVDEINRLLVVVERRLQQSRTAVGNLAHALKTPLAVLFRIAEDPVLADYPRLRQQLQVQTECLRDRLERELNRARLAGQGAAGGDFDARAELEVLTKVLQTVYRDKPLHFEVQVPAGHLPYDRQDLLELLGNLADNASKWATGQVFIGLEQHDGLDITVADDGPGCAPEQVRQLTQRGLRLDESKEGHGLGLAICRDIADFYGGSLAIGRSEMLGGLEVRVHLPRG
jgi:signal transduction histidine kinase